MNIAVVLAGGIGSRVGSCTPKQFIKVFEKPILAYTLEVFEKCREIDAIEVVTLAEYIEEVKNYKTKYNISKLKWVTIGGSSCQESIRNGIFNLKGQIADNDILMIVMGVSPLISDEVISDSIQVCNKYGNAICAMQSIHNYATIKDGYWADNYVYKDTQVTLNMPWTFPFEKLLSSYERAYRENIGTEERAYTPTLMVDLGEKLYFSKDTQKNKLKITTNDDIDMFEGYLLFQKKKGEINK